MLTCNERLLHVQSTFLAHRVSTVGLKEMPLQEVYEEPITPIFIDHEQAVQAYYSRVEEIALKTPPPQNPHSQAPYLPYPEPNQYPAANYPQSYPGNTGPDPQFNPNPYGYHNQYYGQAPIPQYNTASYGYPYPPTNYPQYQYGANSGYPSPAYPPQVPPNQWGGQPVAPTNAPYPNYPYQNTVHGNQYNTTSYGWGDLGSLLPSAPAQLEPNHFHSHTSSGRNYVMEETIQASIAKRNFNESQSLSQELEIGWKI